MNPTENIQNIWGKVKKLQLMPDRSAKGGKTSVCKRWAKNKFFFYIAVIISIISDKQSPPKKKDKQICTLMKLLIKRIAELHKIAAKKVSDDTDLEKIKLLFNKQFQQWKRRYENWRSISVSTLDLQIPMTLKT